MAGSIRILGLALAGLALTVAVSRNAVPSPQHAIPDFSGALILNGCPGSFFPPTSFPFLISGIDAGTLGDDAHAVVTRCQADMETIQNFITDGFACSPQGIYSVASPTLCQRGTNHNPDYPGVSNNNCSSPNCNSTNNSADIFYDPLLSDPNVRPYFANCGGLQAYVDYFVQHANFTYPDGTNSLPTPGDGSSVDPAAWTRVINVINGDANLTNGDFGNPGAGVILVKGNLSVTGWPLYKGVILVIGTGQMTVGGGGSGTVNGAIFLANTSTCSGPTDSPGSVSFNISSGGTFQLLYNSDVIQTALIEKRRPGQVVSE